MDLAFIVDVTVESGDRPRLPPLQPGRPWVEPALGGHGFRAADLIELTQLVYGRAPEAYLLLLPAYDLEFGEELSPRTARAAEIAVRFLNRRLRQTCCDGHWRIWSVPSAPAEKAREPDMENHDGSGGAGVGRG